MRELKTNLIDETFRKIKNKEIDFAEAEYILRPYFEPLPNEDVQNKYEKAYDRLDVLVGIIDGGDYNNFKEEIEAFYKFLKEINL